MWLGHGSCPWRRPPDQRGGGDLAPEPGFEPGTVALTARCSTVELLRNARRDPVYPPAGANLSERPGLAIRFGQRSVSARDPLRHLPAGWIARALLLVIFGVRVHEPGIEVRAGSNIPRDQNPGHHRMVLIVVVMHAIPPHEPQVGQGARQPFADHRQVSQILAVVYRIGFRLPVD